MTLTHTILIESLAAAAALHEPLRDPEAKYWAATWVLRRHFGEVGLPYRGRGDREHERALARAVGAGLVIRSRGVRKTLGVRLTRAGLARAWELVGVGADDALVVAREVARRGPGGRWVAEV